MEKLKNNENYGRETFEEIKHVDESGMEYWYARELMKVLQYSKWENFKKVIEKGKIACKNSGMSIKDCFPDIRKPIISGKGKEEFIEDYKLTRYACYLIAQNGDSRKEVIAKNGGTMPEDLHTPKKSLKQLEKESKNELKV